MKASPQLISATEVVMPIMKTQESVAARGGIRMDEMSVQPRLRVVTDGAQALARRRRILRTDFETIYELYRRKVFLWCLRIVRNPEDAEDLTQDAFLLLFRKIDSFRGEATFSTWLYRLATNIALMRLRRKALPQSSPEEILENHAGALRPHQEFKHFERNMASSIAHVDLSRALDQLPEGYRKAFSLHDCEDYSHEEIAGLTGWSVGTSKSQVHKARRRLRQLLEKSPERGAFPRRDRSRAYRRKPRVGRSDSVLWLRSESKDAGHITPEIGGKFS